MMLPAQERRIWLPFFHSSNWRCRRRCMPLGGETSSTRQSHRRSLSAEQRERAPGSQCCRAVTLGSGPEQGVQKCAGTTGCSEVRRNDRVNSRIKENDVPEKTTSPSFPGDRKSTRLNSSHLVISYAV